MKKTPIDPKTLEFFSLPGLGKSTLSREAKNKGFRQNFNILSKTEYSEWKKNRTCLYRFFVFIREVKTSLILYKLLASFVISFKQKPPGTLSRVLLFPFNLLLRRDFSRKNKRNSAVVLLENGALQDIWSITLFSKEYDRNRLKKLLSQVLKINNYKYVFLSADIQLSSARIAERETFNSRFDTMMPGERYRALAEGLLIFKDISSEVSSLADTKTLEAQMDVSHNVEKIIDYID